MTRADRPILIAHEGELEGERWVLDQDRMTIGRAPDCEIVLPRRQVSRYHARIERAGDGFVVRDLDSKNGTYVNGRAVTDEPYPLQDGDEIQIALYVKLGFIGADATVPLEFTGPYRGLRVDVPAQRVFIGGQELRPPLSAAQFRMLEILYEREGEVVSRDEIVAAVWSDEEALGVTEQAIDALVHRLRERIAAIDPDHEYIVTVRGYGFRLENR